MKTYTCNYCGKEFSSNKYAKYCKECRNTYSNKVLAHGLEKARKLQLDNNNKHRLKVKQLSISYKGNKCQICGYNKCNSALEFHHLNPNEKEFAIGQTGYRHSWESLKTELDKCILVCANCHREIHSNLIVLNEEMLLPTNPEVFNFLNENKNNIKKENWIKHSTINKCEKCALDISIEEFCKSGVVNRRVKRPDTYIQFLMIMDSLKWNFCAAGRYFGGFRQGS